MLFRSIFLIIANLLHKVNGDFGVSCLKIQITFLFGAFCDKLIRERDNYGVRSGKNFWQWSSCKSFVE